jgi:fluoroquinolone resistance protein
MNAPNGIGGEPEYENEQFGRDSVWPPVLEGIDFTDCELRGCELRERRLVRCRFFDCRFERVDASATDFTDCTLRGVTFHDSKLLGINWTVLQSIAGCRWERCILDGGCYQALELGAAEWVECSAHDVDFSDAKLKKARFHGTKLEGASFTGADLERADFSRATGLVLHPQRVRLKQTVVEMDAVLRLATELGLKVAGT